MRNRITRLLIPTILFIGLFSSVTPSQVRRRSTTRQKSAKVEQLTPLTPEQRQLVTDILQRAKSLELTYQTDQSKYVLSAEGMGFFLYSDKMKQFPEGQVKTHLVAMMYGYYDSGVLIGMLTNTGITSALTGLDSSTTGSDRRPKLIEEISRRWNINVMQAGLYQAQHRIFNTASSLKDKLTLLLTRTPTANNVTPRLVSSDWTFPTPGMQGRYSELTKTTMYDLGDNIFAGHIELAPGVPAVAIILPLAIPVPKEEVSDEDMAMIFASKVVKLPSVLSETMLKQEKVNEYRFRTANGKVVIVALAKDRRSAIVKFE